MEQNETINEHERKSSSQNVTFAEEQFCSEARRSISSFLSGSDKIPSFQNRMKAIDTSSWTQEEIELLNKWEKAALNKARIHSKYARKNASRSKWLRFASGLVTTLAGSGSCISFFVKLSAGEHVWGELVFGLITFSSGLVASIGEAFEWENLYVEHDRAKDSFSSLATEIRTIKSTPQTDRRQCEFWINRLTSQFIYAEEDAPYTDSKDLQEEEQEEKRRKNSLWV